jgi:hypothetical protein
VEEGILLEVFSYSVSRVSGMYLEESKISFNLSRYFLLCY